MRRKYWMYLGVLSLVLIFGSSVVNAQQGGYKGPGPVAGITTSAEAKNLPDDSKVILRGKIERFIGDERYLFSDSSGNITIEIDQKIWGTLSVNENDLVEITGEIDRDFLKTEVEVDTIKKIN